MTTNFRPVSHTLNKVLSLTTRKSEGIYFTPKAARDRLFTVLGSTSLSFQRILEPSCGSGEFVLDCVEKYPSAQIDAVEFNEKIFQAVKPVFEPFKTVTLVHKDFLTFDSESGPVYDLIVGNPPYFQIKEKNPQCMTGYPNIYVAFLYKCLTKHLKEDGVLGFVLPTSLYNSSYYEPMRKYIGANCTILCLETLDVNYYQTAQDTMLLVVKKTKMGEEIKKPFILSYKGHTYLTPFATELETLLTGTKTLEDLGFRVKTGDVVWNQHKDKLVSTLEEGGTILVYSTNICGSGEPAVFHNFKVSKGKGKTTSTEKKQYIKGFEKEPQKGSAILVNRGYGNAYRFQYTLLDGAKTPFYAENHVNMILPTTEEAEKNIPLVMKSLGDPRTATFIKQFVGNGALSKTELETVLPIFV